MALTTNQMTRNYSVRNLQIALRTIAGVYPSIDKISADGIYGPETSRAVTQFQKQFGLPETGEVDSATSDRIFQAYFDIELARAQPEPLFAFPSPDAVIGRDDRGGIVYIIQVVLTDAAQRFLDFTAPGITGVYDAATEREVLQFQSRALLPETGRVDRVTWNRLARFYRPSLQSAEPQVQK